MSTYTYNGTSSSDELELNMVDELYEIDLSQYSNYIVNGGSGDDRIYDAWVYWKPPSTQTDTRAFLNGDGGDDEIRAFGKHDAWLSGGDGNDTFEVSDHDDYDISITISGGQGLDSLFVGYPNCVVPTHTDVMNEEDEHEVTCDFFWLSARGNDKKFYVLDKDNNKHYATHLSWFDEKDPHGSDPLPYSTLSVRVDGVFEKEFRKKCLM